MSNRQRGFTLIELLVVIAIIGLLSTLAVVALTSARAKARDAKRISDVKQIQTSLELYFADSGGKYVDVTAAVPLGVSDATNAYGKLCNDGFKAATGACGASTFMGKVPRDPSVTGTANVCTATSDKVCDYAYLDTGDSQSSYQIQFYLEGASGELAKALNCANQDGLKSGACS